MTSVIVTTPEELRALIKAAVREAMNEPRERYPVSDVPVAYVDTKEAAKILGMSVKGLESFRARGEGPPYLRIGRVVRYKVSDLTKTNRGNGQG